MIVKSFTDDSVAAALKQVRAELGGNAVVLHTRQLTDFPGGGSVEITACLDSPAIPVKTEKLSLENSGDLIESVNPDVAAEEDAVNNELTAAPSSAHNYDPELGELNHRLTMIEKSITRLINRSTLVETSGDIPKALRAVKSSLLASDVPASDVAEICQEALNDNTHIHELRKSVRERLKSRLVEFVSEEFDISTGQSALFIGPPGDGKTTVMGKLAARLILRRKKKVRFLSLGATKVGAVDELESFAAILGADLADSAATERRAVSDDEILLVDSPAISATPDSRSGLMEDIARINPTYRVAVCSALTRTADVPKLREMLHPFAPTHLALTMKDLTTRWGTALALCKQVGMKLALVNDSPSGTGELQLPDTNRMLDELLGEGEGGDE